VAVIGESKGTSCAIRSVCRRPAWRRLRRQQDDVGGSFDAFRGREVIFVEYIGADFVLKPSAMLLITFGRRWR